MKENDARDIKSSLLGLASELAAESADPKEVGLMLLSLYQSIVKEPGQSHVVSELSGKWEAYAPDGTLQTGNAPIDVCYFQQDVMDLVNLKRGHMCEAYVPGTGGGNRVLIFRQDGNIHIADGSPRENAVSDNLEKSIESMPELLEGVTFKEWLSSVPKSFKQEQNQLRNRLI